MHYKEYNLIIYLTNIERIKKTVRIETSTVEIEERGVKLRLTVVDTPGYGDGMDNKDRYQNSLSIN
jgi:septin 2